MARNKCRKSRGCIPVKPENPSTVIAGSLPIRDGDQGIVRGMLVALWMLEHGEATGADLVRASRGKLVRSVAYRYASLWRHAVSRWNSPSAPEPRAPLPDVKRERVDPVQLTRAAGHSTGRNAPRIAIRALLDPALASARQAGTVTQASASGAGNAERVTLASLATPRHGRADATDS